MKAYQVVRDEEAAVIYAGTLQDAAKAGKDGMEAVYLPNVRIHEVEIQTDKASILAMLNGEHVLPKGERLVARTGRVWRFTARGGIYEDMPAETA